MTPKSAIEKGKLLEEHVVTELRDKGIDPRAYRSKGSGNGNGEKSDVWTSAMCLGQNIGFECKNQKTLAIPEWWRQTKKLESLSREPVLVFKLPYEPLEDAKVVIYLDTFLELIKRQKDWVAAALSASKNQEREKLMEQLFDVVDKLGRL